MKIEPPAANNNIRPSAPYIPRLSATDDSAQLRWRGSPECQPRVDRNPLLPHSVCGVLMVLSLSPMRKGVLVAVAVLLTPVFLVEVVAFAAGGWRQIGATASGDQVLVSSLTAQRNGLRTAWIRVEYKQPTKLPQGGPFVELRARVRFNCASGGAVPNSEWFYSRDHSRQLVVSKKARRDEQVGQVAEGNFGELTREFVCKQK